MDRRNCDSNTVLDARQKHHSSKCLQYLLAVPGTADGLFVVLQLSCISRSGVVSVAELQLLLLSQYDVGQIPVGVASPAVGVANPPVGVTCVDDWQGTVVVSWPLVRRCLGELRLARDCTKAYST